MPARDYANGSISVVGSASLGVGLFSAPRAGSAFSTVTLLGGVAVRFVSKLGLTFEPRLVGWAVRPFPLAYELQFVSAARSARPRANWLARNAGRFGFKYAR